MMPPILYLPGFLDADQADALQIALAQQQWRRYQISMFGRMIDEPRLIDWCGDYPYVYSRRVLEPRPWVPVLDELNARIEQSSGHAFNHCLMNLYRDGQDYMGWHCDDEPELGPDPAIASLSLGQPRPFQFKCKDTDARFELTLGHGDLLVMLSGCQVGWKHCLPKRAISRVSQARINLTFRRIVGISGST